MSILRVYSPGASTRLCPCCTSNSAYHEDGLCFECEQHNKALLDFVRRTEQHLKYQFAPGLRRGDGAMNNEEHRALIEIARALLGEADDE